jgi:hypothetical protein
MRIRRQAPSERQHSQEHAEDENDKEDSERKEEKNLCDRLRSGSDTGKSEEPGDKRDDEKDDGPLQHGLLLLLAQALDALLPIDHPKMSVARLIRLKPC